MFALTVALFVALCAAPMCLVKHKYRKYKTQMPDMLPCFDTTCVARYVGYVLGEACVLPYMLPYVLPYVLPSVLPYVLPYVLADVLPYVVLHYCPMFSISYVFLT